MTPTNTTPVDYHQQLAAYLQAWRQLFEALAVITAGMPSSGPPWAGPAMPWVPPGPATSPPAPTDYAQQLFGQLQAWRQYLENTVSTATPAVPTPSESESESGKPTPVPPPRGEDGGKSPSPTASGVYVGQAGTSSSTWPPTYKDLQPWNEGAGQWPLDGDLAENHARQQVSPLNEDLSDDLRLAQAARRARGRQVIRVPEREDVAKSGAQRAARRVDPSPVAPTRASSAARQVGPEAALRTGARSPLFKGLVERTPGIS